ncbi:MAG: hypothetical protein JJE07_07455 [Flavobacteriaceae bacterium]|nr:hypothetical protein [Flavobacteriaceae bacterium]
MKLKISIPGNKLFFIAPVSLLLLASCSSYQYSGSDRDGVYGDTRRVYSEQEQYASQDNKSHYYKNLFSEEADLYNELLAEDAIFTDVEGYTSTGGDYTEQQPNYQGGNAPWGQDPDSYSINIYNNGFYGGFYNPYWGGGYYGYNPYWGPGYYGPGYWGSSWSIGFGGYYPYSGFGIGFGFASYPYYYGAGRWYNPYHHNYYRNNYFRQNVAYNSGRRNAVSSFRDGSRSNLRNAVNLDSRRQSSSYSRSIRNLRSSNDQYGLTRRSTGDYNTTRRNSDNRYQRSTQQSTNRTSRRNDTNSRPTTTNRSNTGTVRSSGTTRSSGDGRSSSGGSTSRSRGRGN